MSDISIRMLADSLWVLRKYIGSTQADLASDLGISQSYLCEIEKGDKDVTLLILQKYSEIFKIPMSAILLFAEKESGNIRTSDRKRQIAKGTLSVLRALLPKELQYE